MKKLTPYFLLVLSLSVVYIAFGLPKIFGVSSVKDLIQASFPFFNTTIIAILGIGEVFLGIALLFKNLRSYASIGVILHLLGTFLATVLNIKYFFDLRTVFTLSGEFVFKNVVLIALAIYILSVEKQFKHIKFLNKTNESSKD